MVNVLSKYFHAANHVKNRLTLVTEATVQIMMVTYCRAIKTSGEWSTPHVHINLKKKKKTSPAYCSFG